MFQFDTMAFFGLIAVLLCWGLAVLLFRVSLPDSVARKLSLLLVIEGLTLFSSGVPWRFFSDAGIEHMIALDQRLGGWIEFADGAIHYFGDSMMLALYPLFLVVALNTKLTRPFKGKKARLVLWFSAAALFVAVLTSPPTVGTTLLFAVLTVLFGYSLIASIHAWQIEPPGLSRTRAGVFSLAFGIRDICWGFVYMSGIWRIANGVYGTEADPEYIQSIYQFSTLVYVPIVAYGILRTQMFDIDLKLRWTIKQSTLAGVFVAIMFVISEGAANFLSAELGNVAGVLSAAVVMFFLAPLQRFAERVASTAMPNTKNTPEYAAFRKMQVYESALMEAQFEEGVSDRERTLLNRLRESLGISEFDADAIENELQTRSLQAA